MFSVSSVYHNLTGDDERERNNIWEQIWRIKAPNRVCMFMWQTLHERIMCNKVRYSRGFTNNAYCFACRDKVEDTEHVLRSCPRAKDVWIRIMPRDRWEKTKDKSMHEWVRIHTRSDRRGEGDRNWSTIFALTLWWI